MSVSRRLTTLGGFCATLLAFTEPLAARSATTRVVQDLAHLPHGRVVERVTSRANPRQEYAVYLPERYSTDRQWPLLVLLDPRGRALLPLERIREVAERLGYLVLSSYNSRSDEPVDPNADAINAMLDDADRMLAIDPRRIYLVGQSGTARANWIFGSALKGHVAGLIGIGAATPDGFPLAPRTAGAPPGLLFFGAAGTTDYNFDEMWLLDRRLDSLGLPHRITTFEGPHAWPPAATLIEAVEWMELQAMRFGQKPADPQWIDALLAARQAAARALEADAPHQAWRAWRGIAADFEGLRDVTEAARTATRLERTPEVHRTEQRLEELVRQQVTFAARLGAFLGESRVGIPPSLAQARERLQLPDLLRRARASADPLAAQAAVRSLEHVWVYTAFYEPRDYLAAGEAVRALAMLDIAEALRADDAEACLYRAESLAALGRAAEAVGAAECATRGGISPWRLEEDPALASVVAAPTARAAIARVAAAGGGRYWP